MTEPVLAEAIGIIDGANVDFSTPVAYQPGTLFAYLNGILVQQSGTEGPIELGGVDVRMREAPRTDDTLHFYFDTGPPTPGAFLPPPILLSALSLVPVISGSMNLRPTPISAEGEEPENVPENMSAQNLSPEPTGATDLRPKMISAEEQ